MIVKELFARLGMKVDDASVNKAGGAIDKVKSAAKALAGILAAGAVAKGFSNIAFAAAKAGDEVAKTSKQLGINAQALQELRFAADLAGVEGATFAQGLGVLQKNARDASLGSKTMADAFKTVGVNVKNADGTLKSAEVLIGEISDGMAGMTDSTERTGVALTLMGRTGKRLIPFLEQGSAAINEQRKEAIALGGVMSDELLKQSEELIDAQTRWGRATQGVRNAIAKLLLPSLTATINRLALVVASIGKWVSQSALVPRVLQAIKLATAALALVMIVKLVAAFGALATVMVGATGAMAAFNFQLLLTQARALLLGSAFLLLLGLLFLIADEIATAIEGGETLGKDLGKAVSDVLDQFLEFETDNPFIRFLQKALEGAILLKNAVFGLALAATGDLSGLKTVAEDAREFLGLGLAAKPGTVTEVTTTGPVGGTSNRSVNVGEINVNAAPGQDEAGIAENVKDFIVGIFDDRDAEDEQVLIPAQQGVVR